MYRTIAAKPPAKFAICALIAAVLVLVPWQNLAMVFNSIGSGFSASYALMVSGFTLFPTLTKIAVVAVALFIISSWTKSRPTTYYPEIFFAKWAGSIAAFLLILYVIFGTTRPGSRVEMLEIDQVDVQAREMIDGLDRSLLVGTESEIERALAKPLGFVPAADIISINRQKLNRPWEEYRRRLDIAFGVVKGDIITLSGPRCLRAVEGYFNQGVQARYVLTVNGKAVNKVADGQLCRYTKFNDVVLKII